MGNVFTEIAVRRDLHLHFDIFVIDHFNAENGDPFLIEEHLFGVLQTIPHEGEFVLNSTLNTAGHDDTELRRRG